MKRLALFLACAASALVGLGQCPQLAESCAKSIGDAYLVDPNFFSAEIGPRDIASFRAVWLKGHTYRLNVCTSDNQPAQWMVYDEKGTLLFANNEFQSAVQWDFLCDQTMHVQLVVKLHSNAVQPACVTVVHGFKK